MNEVVIEFFKKFSRLEFSLKYAGYVYSGNNNIATPDWRRFILENSNRYAVINKPEAVNLIMTNPPNSLYLQEGDILIWNVFIPPNSTELGVLCQHLKTVRNNLFHGNKMLPGNDEERNRILIESCIEITDFIAALDDGVLIYY